MAGDQRAAAERLMRSEANYVEELEVLQDRVTLPLLHDAQAPHPKLLPHARDVPVFLGCVADILTLNGSFLRELTDATESTGAEAEAVRAMAALQRYAPLFKIYGQYLSKLDAMLELFSFAASEREAFKSWLKGRFESLPSHSDPLGRLYTLLCLPRTRLQDYSAYTNLVESNSEKGSPARVRAESAREALKATQEYVDFHCMIAKQKVMMRELEGQWRMALNAPGRLLLKQGELAKVSRRCDITYVFLLFTDCLMYGSRTPSHHIQHHRTMSLQTLDIREVPNEPSFQITAAEKSFVVLCTNLEDKYSWMIAIRKAAHKYRAALAEDARPADEVEDQPISPSAFAPVWKQDALTDACSACQCRFTVTRRKHHCRSCGDIFCQDCVSDFVSLRNFTAPQRVCGVCACLRKDMVPSIADEDLGKDDDRGGTLPTHSARSSSLTMLLPDFKHLRLRRSSPTPSQSSVRSTTPQPKLPMQPAQSSQAPPQAQAVIDMIKESGKNGAAKTTSQRVIEELIVTEDKYVRHVEALFQLFVEPILHDSHSRFPSIGRLCSVTSPDRVTDMSAFLHSIEPLLTLNSNLLVTLCQKVAEWDSETTIGDVFLRFVHLFSMYSQFATHQAFASQVLADWMTQDRDFADFVAEAEAHERCGGQSLQSMLIMPIQRVPRYQLLLQEYVKQLKKECVDHTDVELVEEALDKIKEAATHINRMIKLRESRERIIQLQALWGGRQLLIPGRVLLNEGPLQKQCRRRLKWFDFLLFNDCIMYGERLPSSSAVVFHRELPLKQCRVELVPFREGSPAVSLSFQVVSPRKAFVLLATAAEERDAWYGAIDEQIQQVTAGDIPTPEQYAPVWMPNSRSKVCVLCGKPFGVLHRRHHCRRCGALACDTCSSRRVILADLSPTRPGRVCTSCWAQGAGQCKNGTPSQAQPLRRAWERFIVLATERSLSLSRMEGPAVPGQSDTYNEASSISEDIADDSSDGSGSVGSCDGSVTGVEKP